jgi:hypothetical protein
VALFFDLRRRQAVAPLCVAVGALTVPWLLAVIWRILGHDMRVYRD